MRNFTIQTMMGKSVILIALLLMLSGKSLLAQTLPITGYDAVRCGAGIVEMEVSWSGEALDPNNVKWYTVPFYGTPFHTGLTFTTDYLEMTTTFYVDYVDDNECGECDRLLIKAVIFDVVISNQVFYESTTFCNSSNLNFSPTIVGAQEGTFHVAPTGGGSPANPLSINPETGVINPYDVTSGTYTITYLPPEVSGCDSDPVSIDVTITDSPLEPEISYTPNDFCAYPGAPTIDVDFSIPAYTPPTGATFNSVPTGLCINSTTGQINPQNCMTGIYTITYYVPGGGGCSPVIKATQVTVLQLPTASISYNSPFTLNMGPQQVTIAGTGDYLGGTFTHDGDPGDLDLNAATGEIIPANSVQGSYLITYTLAAVSPCVDGVVATTNIEILSLPVAQISAQLTEVCQYSVDEPEVAFTGSAGLPPYTIVYSINDGLTQDITTTGNLATINHPTLVTGSYTYKIHSVSDDNGSVRVYAVGDEPFATINVNAQSHGLFEYAESPYCSDGSNPVPTMLDGGVQGTFTSTAGLVFIDESTGEINIALSSPGTYSVSNTIAASGGCPESVTIVDVTITALPIAGFSYDPAYCNNGANPIPTFDEGAQAGIFSVDQPGLVFVSPTTGEINLASSLPGTYIITNTIAASDGCGVVTASDEVTIEPLPVITNNDELIICSNTSPDIALTASLASSFTWTIGSITGNITGAEAGSGAVIEQVLINPSNTEAGSVEYIIVPTSVAAGCVGDAFTITVTVKPLPVLTSSLTPDAICSELAFEYEATSSATGATFSWSRAVVAGIEEGASTGGTAFVNEVLTNTTNASIDVVYEFTIIADGCSNTQYVTVGVNPTPSVTNIELAQAICSGGTISAVELTSDIVGATLSWIAYPSAGIAGYIATGTGTIPAQTLTNSLTTDGSVTYVIAPTLGNCYGAEVEYIVTVHALPVCDISGPETVTYGDETQFTAPAGMTTYAWSITGDGSIVGASNEQTVNVSADAAGSYTLSLEIINSNGCTSTCNRIVTVNPAMLTVTADPQLKVYGSANPALTFGYSGFVLGQDATSLTTQPTASTTVDENSSVDVYLNAITVSGGVSSNYDFTYVPANLTVTKAMLTVTADSQTKVYGSANPTLTFGYSGFVLGQDATSLTTQPTASTTVDENSGVDVYLNAITVSGGVSSNYDFTYVPANFTVTKAMLTVTADPQTKVYGSANPALTFQYSGFVLNQNETVLITEPTANTLIDENTIAGVHEDAITVSGGVDANYDFTYVPSDFEVTARSLTITATAQEKEYSAALSGAAGYTLFTSDGLTNNETIGSVTVTYTGGHTATADVGIYENAIEISTAIGGTFTASNYTITYVNGTLEVTSRPLEITANNVSKSYGTVLTFENNEFTLTSGTTLADGHTMTLTLSSAGAEANALAGFYILEIHDVIIKNAGNITTTDNYDISLINGTLWVLGPVIVYNQDPSEPNTEIIATHMTIQSAIDAETTLNGHYVAVSSGNYDELLNVTKEITISGHGANNTLIQSSDALSTNILSITASNVAIKDIAIVGPGGSSPPSRGIHINGTLSGVALVNVISNQHLYGVHVNAGSDIANLTLTNTVLNINGNGLQIDAEAKVDGLTITNGEMAGNLFGFSTAATLDNYDNSNDLNNVTITGTSFSGNMYFGLMFNKGKNVNLNGITVNGNGNVSGAPGSGIYFTWREGTYSNIIVQNSTITNNGQNAGATDGGGILVRPRANAIASGISIENNLISDNGAAGNGSAGIRVLKNDENTGTDPGIAINGNSIASNANHGITSTTSANIDASCNWWGTANYNEILLIVSTKVQFVNYLIPGAGDTYPWSGVDTYSCTGVE